MGQNNQNQPSTYCFNNNNNVYGMWQNNQNQPSIYCFNGAFLYVLHSLVSFPLAAKEIKPFEQFYDSKSAGIFKVSSWSNIILGAMITKEKTPKLCFCSKANKQKQSSTNDNENLFVKLHI